ncbi:MAG: 50S ribosomal protein L3 [Elusimicrobiota bacterium]
MIDSMMGKKLGMSRIFNKEGKAVAVTLLSCGPCYVVDKKGDRLQLGYLECPEKKLKKPRAGYLKKRGVPPLRHLKEVKILEKEGAVPEIGEKIYLDIFEEGEKVNVKGISKGKGFAGVMKRWNFRGGPGGHGSGFTRGPGAIGNASDPSRVFPGMKMAGRKGGRTASVMNLRVEAIDREENIIAVKGSVAGPKKGLVLISKSGRV